MNVKLTWTDRNTNEDGHRIYRSSSPMDTLAMPSPVAEIGPNVTAWEDIDTPVDQEVYYVVSALRGDEEVFSDEVLIDTTPAEPLPTVFGEPYGGGFYAGEIQYPDGQWYKLIVADIAADIAGATWKTSNSITDGADSLTDGVANTSSMIAAGITLHPAANHCINYSGGGNSDWYMPAKDELNVIYQNLGYARPNCPAAFLSGGVQSLAGAYYWASTQNGGTYGWGQRFSDGWSTGSNKTDATRRVRPVRRIAFTP